MFGSVSSVFRAGLIQIFASDKRIMSFLFWSRACRVWHNLSMFIRIVKIDVMIFVTKSLLSIFLHNVPAGK